GKAPALDPLLDRTLEQVVVERVLRGQLRAIDRRQGLEWQIEIGLASRDRGGRDIGPSVVLAGAADLGGEFRELVHQIIPVQVKEPSQALALRSLAGFGDQALDARTERVRRRAEGESRGPEKGDDGSE